MKVLEESGLLDSLVAAILRTFYRRKVALLLTVMLLLMFPGMITGSSLAAVLSTGPLIAPVLMKLGLPRLRTAAFVALGAVLGMIAPPVNILIMIMGAGVDMPYTGLTLPLLLATVPAAIVIALGLGLKQIRVVSEEEMLALLPPGREPAARLRPLSPHPARPRPDGPPEPRRPVLSRPSAFRPSSSWEAWPGWSAAGGSTSSKRPRRPSPSPCPSCPSWPGWACSSRS